MGKWVKGESGNPGGRPAGYGDIRELARPHASRAIAVLVEVMDNPDAAPSARQAAAVALLDRGFGRPELNLSARVTPGESYRDVLQEVARRVSEEKARELEFPPATLIEDKSEP